MNTCGICGIPFCYTEIEKEIKVEEWVNQDQESPHAMPLLETKCHHVFHAVCLAIFENKPCTECKSILKPQVSFEKVLDEWVKQASKQEKFWRTEAKLRILECREMKTTSLDLSSLNLTSLPHCIGRLNHVEELILTRNKLADLPETLGDLEKLYHLNVDFNELRDLPESIGELQWLSKLSLCHNNFLEIPSALHDMPFLNRLYFDYNSIDHIPFTIGTLTNLETLSLVGNHASFTFSKAVQGLKNLEIVV